MAVQWRTQRGSVSVELVLLVPLAVLLAGLMTAGWRIWSAKADVQRVADAAARAASQQRSGAVAQVRAQAVVDAQLAGLDVGCRDPQVRIDVTGFLVPAGQPARVSVAITCSTALSDLGVPGLPGQIEVSADAESVLDQFAERGP